MEQELVKIGQHVINLKAVAAAHWENGKLFVHLVGGRFLSFRGSDADVVWSAVNSNVVDLRTGEVAEKGTGA